MAGALGLWTRREMVLGPETNPAGLTHCPPEAARGSGWPLRRRLESTAPTGAQHTLVPADADVTAPYPTPTRGTGKASKAEGEGREGPRPETHFSLPSPTTAILLLSSVQAMSLILPAKG